MINKLLLVKAIEDKQNGVSPNFSNIELNQAVDLVIFNNYSIDEVCKMDSYELDEASSDDNDIDTSNYYICPTCGKKLEMWYDGERYEGYTGSCDCGKDFKVSSYGLDDAMDADKNLDEHDYIQSVMDSRK